MFYSIMADRPASWRMPTPEQMDKLAAELARRDVEATTPTSSVASDADRLRMPEEPRFFGTALPIQKRRLSEIAQPLLRFSCRRCERIVEIRSLDALRLYGPHAIWKDVAQRLLNDGCEQRTGRHEEDGCWPKFGAS